MHERGQSEVIGFIMLLGLVVAGTTGIVVLGADAITDTREIVTSGSAEHGMTQFDSKASLVAHGDSDSHSVRLGGASSADRSVEPDRGWINVTIRNESDPTVVEEELMNVSLGAVVYEDGDTTVAYQGGGVWKSTGSGSTMVSPPEFHYRGTTFTLPLVVADGDPALGDRAQITRGGPERPVYPNESAPEPLMNPLEEGEVHVEVQSEFYEAWGRFFTERTGGQSSVDHDNETATIRLVTPANVETIGAALSSSAAGDELKLSGSGSNPAFVDSYNSDDGNYSVSKSENGTVSTAGDFTMGGNAKVVGNVESGGTVSLKGSSNVTKEAGWTTGFTAGGSAEYGSEQQIDGVQSADSVESFVLQRVGALSEQNANHETAAIDNDQLTLSGSGDSVTLSASDGNQFYLTDLQMDGQELVVDTNDQEVEIAVQQNVDLDNSDIRVEGDGRVRIYSMQDVDLDDGTNVSVPGDRSNGLWIYGTSDTEIGIEGSSGNPVRFVGVFYVPTDGGEADVDIQHAAIYGGIVAGEMDVGTGGEVHFDESLKSENPLPEEASVPRVTYLHVSVTEIEVEDK